jgi:uncharacterized membrane protein YdbT with pleckstrin-like domain
MNKKGPRVIKPSIVNALFPVFLRNFFYVLLIGLPIFGLAILLNYLDIFSSAIWVLSLYYFGGAFILSILTETWNIILLWATTYTFDHSHIKIERKIFSIKTKTVPYKHIVNTNTVISLWDRISNAGDVILHTAESTEAGDIKLLFIKNPLEVEKEIHSLILKKKH